MIKTNGYFSCEGKKLCPHCKYKSSKSNLPKLNIVKKHKVIKIEKIEESDNKFSISLTKDEYNYFRRKLIKQGYEPYEAHNKISQIIEVIKSNHKKYKKKDIDFSEEFNKLL